MNDFYVHVCEMERDKMNPDARPGAAFNTCMFGKDELFPVLRDSTATEIRSAKDLHERLKHNRQITPPVPRSPRRSQGVARGAKRPTNSPTGFGRSRYVWIHNERHMLFKGPQHASENFRSCSSELVPNESGRQGMLAKVGDALASVPILLGDQCRTYGYRLCDRRVGSASWAEFGTFPRDKCKEGRKAKELTPPRVVQPRRWNSHDRTPHSNGRHDGASSHFISHSLDDPSEPEVLRSVPHRQMYRDFREILTSTSNLPTEMGHGLQCFQSSPFYSHGETSPYWSGEGASRGKRIHSLLDADLSRYTYPALRDNPYYYPNERSMCGKVKQYKQKRDRNSVAYGKIHVTRSLLQDYLLQPRENAMVTAFLTLLTTMPDSEEKSCSSASVTDRSSVSSSPYRLDSMHTFSESLGNMEIQPLFLRSPSRVSAYLPASGHERVGHVTKTDASALQEEGTSILQPELRGATKVNAEFKQTKEMHQQMEHLESEQVTPQSEASHAVGQYISSPPWYESHSPMKDFCTQKCISTSPTMRTEANRDPTNQTTPSPQTGVEIYSQSDEVFNRTKKKSRSEDSDSSVTSESSPKISQLPAIDDKEKASELLKSQSSKHTVEANVREKDDFTIKETTAENCSDFTVASGNQKKSGDEAEDSVRISLQEKLAIDEINSVDGTRKSLCRTSQVLLCRSSSEYAETESSKESRSPRSILGKSSNEFTGETSEKMKGQYENIGLLKEKASLENDAKSSFRISFKERYSNETITETSRSSDDLPFVESEQTITEDESLNEVANKAIRTFKDLVPTSSIETISIASSTSYFADSLLKMTVVDNPLERPSVHGDSVHILEENSSSEKPSLFTRHYAPIGFKIKEQGLDKGTNQATSGIQEELTINKDKSVDERCCETNPYVQGILNIDNKSDLSHEDDDLCATTSKDSKDKPIKIKNESMGKLEKQENPQVQDALTNDKNKSTHISRKVSFRVQNEFITRKEEHTNNVPNVDSVAACSSIPRDEQMLFTKEESGDTVEADSKQESLNKLVWSDISYSLKTSPNTDKEPLLTFVGKEFIVKRSPRAVGPKILRKMCQLFGSSGPLPCRDDKKPAKFIHGTQTIVNRSKFSRPDSPAIHKRDQRSSLEDEVSNMTKKELTEKPLNLISSRKMLSKVCESPGNFVDITKEKLSATSSQFPILPQVPGHLHQPSLGFERVTSGDSLFTIGKKQSTNVSSMSLAQSSSSDQTFVYGATSSVSKDQYPHKDNLEKPVELEKCSQPPESKSIQVYFQGSSKKRLFKIENKPNVDKSSVDESPLSHVKDEIQKWNTILCQEADTQSNIPGTHSKRRFSKFCRSCRDKKALVTPKEKVKSKWHLYQEQQYVIDRDRGVLDIPEQLKKMKDNSLGKSKCVTLDGHKQHQIHSDQRFRMRMPKAKFGKNTKHLYANKSCFDFYRSQSVEKLVPGKSGAAPVLGVHSFSFSSQSSTQLKAMYTTFPYASEITAECSELLTMDRPQYLLSTPCQPRCLSDGNQINETWLSKTSLRQCYESLEEGRNDENDSSLPRFLTEKDSDQLVSKSQSVFVQAASSEPLFLYTENNLQTPWTHSYSVSESHLGNYSNVSSDIQSSQTTSLRRKTTRVHTKDGKQQIPNQEIVTETNAQKGSAGTSIISRRMSSSSGGDPASSIESCRVSSCQSNKSYDEDDDRSLRISSTECMQQSLEDIANDAVPWSRAAETEQEIVTPKEGFYENKQPSLTSYSDSDSVQSDVSSANFSSNWSRSFRTESTPTTYYTTKESSTTSEFAAILALDEVILDAELKFRTFFEESSDLRLTHGSQEFDTPFVVDMAKSLHKDVSQASNDSWLSLKTAVSTESTLTNRPFKSDIKEAVVPESEKSGNESKPCESRCLFNTNVEKMKAILLETSHELLELKKTLEDRKVHDPITLLVCRICDSLSSAWLAEVSKLPTARNLDSSSDSYNSSSESTFLTKNEETSHSQLKTNDNIPPLDDHPPINEGLRQGRKKSDLYPLYPGKCESVEDESLSSSSSVLARSQSAPENHEHLGDLYQIVINLFATLQQELQKSVKEDTKVSAKSSQGAMAYTIKRKALNVVKTYSQNNWFIKQVLEKPVLYLCHDPSDPRHKKRTKPCVPQRHTYTPPVFSTEQTTESSEENKGLGISPSSSTSSLFYESPNSSVDLPFQNLSGGNCSAESNSEDFHSACNFIHTDVLDNTLDKFNSKMMTIKGKINHMLNLINKYNTSLSKGLEGEGLQFYGNHGTDGSAACNENTMFLHREKGNSANVLYIPGNKDEASKTVQFHCAQENLMDEFVFPSILECPTYDNNAVQSLAPINLVRVPCSQPVIYRSSVVRHQYSLKDLMNKHSREVKTSLTKERIGFIIWKWRRWAIKRAMKVHIDKGRQLQSISVNRSFTTTQRGDSSVRTLNDRGKNSSATRENQGKKCPSSNIFVQPESAANGSLPLVFRTSQLLRAPLSNDFSQSGVRESRSPLTRLHANKEESSFPSNEFVDLTAKIETAEVQSPRKGGKNRVLHKSPPMKDKLTDNLVAYESTGTMKYGDCFVDVFQQHQVKMPLKSSARNLGSETQRGVPLRKHQDNRNLLVKRKRPLNDTIPRCAYRSRRYLQQCYGSASQNNIKRLPVSTSHPMMERPQAVCTDRLKYTHTNCMKAKYLSGSRFRDASSRPSGKNLPIKVIQQVKSDHCKTEQNRAHSEDLTRDLLEKGSKMVSESKYLTSDKIQHKSVNLAEDKTYLSKKDSKVFRNPKHLTNDQEEQNRVGLTENKAYLPRKERKIASHPKALTTDLSTREHKNISHPDLSMTHHTSATRLEHRPSDLFKIDNETFSYCQPATKQNSKQKSSRRLEQLKKREDNQGFFKQIFQKLRSRLSRPSFPPSGQLEVHAGRTLQEPHPLVLDKDFTRFGHLWPLSYGRVSGQRTSEQTCYTVAQPLMYSPPHSVSIHTHVSNLTSSTSTPSPQHLYPLNVPDHAPFGKTSCRPEQRKESTQAMTHASQESIGFVPLRNAEDILTCNQCASNASRAEEEESPAEQSPSHEKPVSRRKDSSRRALRCQLPRAAGNVPRWRSVRSLRSISPRVSINNKSMKIRVSNEDEAVAQNIAKGWPEMGYLPWSSSEEACGKEELMLKFLQECSKWQNKRLHDNVTSKTAAESLENHQTKDRLNYKDELQSAKPRPLGKDDHRPLCSKHLVKCPDFRQRMLRPTNLKPRKLGSTQEMSFRTVSGHQTIYVRESEIRRVHSSEPNPHQKSCCDNKNRTLPERQLTTFTVLPEHDASRMMRNARVYNFMQMSNPPYFGVKRNLSEEGAKEFYSFPEELPPTTKRKGFLAERRHPVPGKHCDDPSSTSDVRSRSRTSESYISSSPEVQAKSQKALRSCILKTSLKGNGKFVHIKQEKEEETEANMNCLTGDLSHGFLLEDNSTNMNDNMPVLSECLPGMKTALSPCLRDNEGTECDKEHVISSLDEASAVYLSMCVVDKVRDPATGHSIFNLSGSGRGANFPKVSGPSRSSGDYFDSAKRVGTKRRHRHGSGSPPRRVREHEHSPTSGYSSYTFSPISDLQEESQNAIFSSDSFKSLPASSSSQTGDDDDKGAAVRNGVVGHKVWKAPPPPCRRVPCGRQKQRNFPDAENKHPTKSRQVPQVSNKKVKVLTQAYVFNCRNLSTDPMSETPGFRKTPNGEGVVKDVADFTNNKRSPKVSKRYPQHLEPTQSRYSGPSLPQKHRKTTKPDPRVADPGDSSSNTPFLTFCAGTASMDKTSVPLKPGNTYCNASVNNITSPSAIREGLMNFQGRLKNASHDIPRSGVKFSPVRQSLMAIEEERDLRRPGVEPSAACKAFDSAKPNDEFGASSSVLRGKTLDSNTLSESPERPMTVAEKIAFYNQVFEARQLTRDNVLFKDNKQKATDTTHSLISLSTSDPKKTTFCSSESKEGGMVGMPASQKPQNLELNTDNEDHGTSLVGDHADPLDSVGHQQSTLSSFYSQLRALFTRTSLPPMQSSPGCSKLGECLKDKSASPVSDVLYTSAATSLSSAGFCDITSLSSRTSGGKEPVADSCQMNATSQMASLSQAKLRNQRCDDSSDETAGQGPCKKKVPLLPGSQKTSTNDNNKRLSINSTVSAEKTRHHQVLDHLRISTDDLLLEQSPDSKIARVLQWMRRSQKSLWNQSREEDTARKETIQDHTEGPHRRPIKSNIYGRSEVAFPENNVLYKRYYDARPGPYHNLLCKRKNIANDGSLNSAHLELESAGNIKSAGTRKKVRGRYKRFQRNSGLSQSSSLSNRHGSGDDGNRSVVSMQATGDDSKPRTGDTEKDLDTKTLISSKFFVIRSRDKPVIIVDQRRLRKRQTIIMTSGHCRKDVSKDTEKAFSAPAGHAHGHTDTSESLTRSDCRNHHLRSRNCWYDYAEQTSINFSKNANSTERLPADASRSNKSHPVYDDQQSSETITGRNESCKHGRDSCSDKTAALVSLAVQDHDSSYVKRPTSDRQHRQPNLRIYQNLDQAPLQGACKAMVCKVEGWTRVPSQDSLGKHCRNESSAKIAGTHQRQGKTSAYSSMIRHGEGGDCTQFSGNGKTFAYVEKTSDIQTNKSSVGTANREKSPKCVTSRATVDKSPTSSICSAATETKFNECYRSSSSNLTNNDHNVTQAAASHEDASERFSSSKSEQSPYISCWSDTSHSIHSEPMFSPVDATVSDVLNEESLSEQFQGIVYRYVTTFVDGNKHPASFQTKTAIERDLKENIRRTIDKYIMNIVTKATDSQKTSSLHRHINTENNQPLGENIERMAHRCITETTDMAYRAIVSETMSCLVKTNTLDGSTCLASKPLNQNMKTINEQSVTVKEKKLQQILCQHVKNIISQGSLLTISASPARNDRTDQSLQAGSLPLNCDTFSSTDTKVSREKSEVKPEENSRTTPRCWKEITGEETPAAASNARENGQSVKRSNIGESESHDYKQDSVQTPGHLTFSKQHSAQTLHPQVCSHQHSVQMSGQLMCSKQEISRNDSAIPDIQCIKGQHLGLEATTGARSLDGQMPPSITFDRRTQRPEVKTSATEERRGDSTERLNKSQHWMRPRNLRMNRVREDEIRQFSASNDHHGRPQSQAINLRVNVDSRQSAELRNDRSPSSSCLTSIKGTNTNSRVDFQDGKINKLTTAEKENLTTFKRDTVFGSKQSLERGPGFDNRKTTETKQSSSVRPVQAAVRPEKAKSFHLFDNETNVTSIDEDTADTVGVENYFQRYQRDACSMKLKAQDSIKSQPNTLNFAQDKSKTRDILQDKSSNSKIKPPKVASHAQESVTDDVRCSTRHAPASLNQGTGRKPSTLTAKTDFKKRPLSHDKSSPRCQMSTDSLGYDKDDDSSKQTPPVSPPVEKWDICFPMRNARHYSPETSGKDSVTVPQLDLLPSLPCMGSSFRPAPAFQANKTPGPASSSAQRPVRKDPSSLGAKDPHTTFVGSMCPFSHSLGFIADDDFSRGTCSERSKALKKQRNTNADSACANSSITSPQSFTVLSQTIEEQTSPSIEIHVPMCPHGKKVTAKGTIAPDYLSASVGASRKDKKQKESSRFITEKDAFPACAVRGEKTNEDDTFLSISCSGSFSQSIGTTEMSLLDGKNIPNPQVAQERVSKQTNPSLNDTVTGKKRRKNRDSKKDTTLSPSVKAHTSKRKSPKSKGLRDGEKGSSSRSSSSKTSTKAVKENEKTVGKETKISLTIQSKGVKRLTESEEDVRERIAQARNLLKAQEQLMVLNRKFQDILRQTLVSMRDEMLKEEERWKKAQSRKARKTQHRKKLIEESKQIAQVAMSEALQQLQTRLCSIEKEAHTHVKGEIRKKTISKTSLLTLWKKQESNGTSVHTWNSKCSECAVRQHPTTKRTAVCTCSRPRFSYGGKYDSRTPAQPPRNDSSESFLSTSIYSSFSKPQNHGDIYSYPSFETVPSSLCLISEEHSSKHQGRTICGCSSCGCNISRHFNNNWNSIASGRKRNVYRIYSELALNTKNDTKKFNVPYRPPHRGTSAVDSRFKKSPKTRTVDPGRSSIQMSSRLGSLEQSNDKDRKSAFRQKLMRIHKSFFEDLKKLAKRIAKDGAQSSKNYSPYVTDGDYLKNWSSKDKYLLSLRDVSRIAAAVSMTAADIGLTNKWKRLSSFLLDTPNTLHHLSTDRYNSRRVGSNECDFITNKNKSAAKYNLARKQTNCRPRPVTCSGTTSFLSLTYCDSNEYVTGKSSSRSDLTSTDYNSLLDSSSSLSSTSKVSSTITLHRQFSSMSHHDAADAYAQSSNLSISIVGCSAQVRKNSRAQVNPECTNFPLDKAMRNSSTPRKLKLTIKHSSSADCKKHHQQRQEQHQHPPGYFGYMAGSELNTDFHDGLSKLTILPSCFHSRPHGQAGEETTRTLCYRLPNLRENRRREQRSSDHNMSHIMAQNTNVDFSSTRRLLMTMIKENMSGRGRLQHMSTSRRMSYGQMLMANSNVLRNMRMAKAFSESTLQSLYKDAIYQYYLQCQHRRHCRRECKGRK